jgi:hypothetical protein
MNTETEIFHNKIGPTIIKENAIKVACDVATLN